MAKIIKTETKEVTISRRCWRINIETPEGQDYKLTAYREQVETDQNGEKKREQSGAVGRSLSTVAAQTVTLTDGTVLTPIQVAEGLSAFIEKWEDEDLAV